MLHDFSVITKAALLSDVVKIGNRAANEQNKPVDLCLDIMYPSINNSETGQQILRCIRNINSNNLGTEECFKDDLAYIIHEALIVAAGTEYKEDERMFSDEDPSRPLENIFNLFDGMGDNSYFPLQIEDGINYPKRQAVLNRSDYERVMNSLKSYIHNRSIEDTSANELLRILEDVVINVPYSINKTESNDVSLYDHAKIAAAVATSLARYCNNHGIADYQDFFWRNAQANRSEKTLLFISGDFSGIQKFIYHVQSKGAMRMLRGRSFYLDIVLENVVDELLEELCLSKANLIYCGGGHFYFIADNSDETKHVLQEGFSKVNRKLAEMFSASLYLAFAWEEISENDLMIQKTWQQKNIFQRVGEKLSIAKQKRYEAKTLAELFEPDSSINLARKDSRECGLCHRSVNSLKPFIAQANYGETDSVEVCEVCNGLYQLGKDILDYKTLFVVLDETEAPDNSVELPSSLGKRYLTAVDMQTLEFLKKNGCVKRIYEKNQIGMAEKDALRVWVGDYAAQKDNVILDLSDLAQLAGGENSETGIKRLGILRADVDNLGAAFIAGLRKANLENPDSYATLTRYSALSRQMTMFFKRMIINVCKKQLPEDITPFYLFNDKGNNQRMMHIIYSGGDDLFLVGAWDDLLEFSVDLRKAFRVYTNGKLSFSAGLGFFSSKYPVSRMAEITGRLEDAAKKLDGKDGVALFGEHTELRSTREKEAAPAFKWKIFEEKVCKEKLQFLLQHFAIEGLTKDTGKNLQAGKSLLYRLMALLTTPRRGNFNLARFAYTIARLEPDKRRNADRIPCYQEVRKELFLWAQSEEDKMELVTAIRLIIYRMRDK